MVASVSGSAITIYKAGTITITANQEGGTNHHPAAPVAQLLTVKPMSLDTFKGWAAAPIQGLTAGVNDGPLDDPDFDGFSNLLEFVLGGEPMAPSQTIQPKLTQVGGNWVYSYHRSHYSKSSTTQVVEQGNDLTGWTPLIVPADTAGDVTITAGASADLVEVILPTPSSNHFVRLKVSP
jgi:hypothetical protein